MKEVARERKIEIGIITTPAEEAQNVANMLVEAEVRGILNFAPAHVTVPEGFVVKDVFLHHRTGQPGLPLIQLSSN
jgi:redox-sensing transcriptional repressor